NLTKMCLIRWLPPPHGAHQEDLPYCELDTCFLWTQSREGSSTTRNSSRLLPGRLALVWPDLKRR
ncbi:hypothetical protein H0H92_010062, partial [Tricholoma furcatifolium]